jgi:phosphogluconate dehydratase
MPRCSLHDTLRSVTDRIIERSKPTRSLYLERIAAAAGSQVSRHNLSCSNLAHAMAVETDEDKARYSGMQAPNIGIVTAYNDMLSAHQPFATYPPLIKRALMDVGATTQVAGGVPAMCDGVTQSQPGMELSLFSRDTIAMSTAVALSHNVFDGALYLGVCDKIVPGLLIGALSFGHLPAIFIPAGPMESGVNNSHKAAIRQEYAKGIVKKEDLLKVESASYHSSGTCTFYGTANSNQMLLDIMGLHMPGGTFVNANSSLREKLTIRAAEQIVSLTQMGNRYMPVGSMLDERSFVNAIVGLMATGGSSNHTIHLIAMAKAAGILLDWDDFNALSKMTPLLAKMYPNGNADVNHFRDAGGMGFIISQLLDAALIHGDVKTILGEGLASYASEAVNEYDMLAWKIAEPVSRDPGVLTTLDKPFSPEGGLSLLEGNIGRSVIKTSALKENHLFIDAPAVVFDSQEALQAAFKAGELNHDFVAVVRFQGPKANGMPELHGLMPPLGALQDAGHHVAIVTDGRMSGASGKVPSAIHMSPEALDGGLLARIETGDRIVMDITNHRLELMVDPDVLAERSPAKPDLSSGHYGVGRELFGMMRQQVSSAETGATIFQNIGEEV